MNENPATPPSPDNSAGMLPATTTQQQDSAGRGAAYVLILVSLLIIGMGTYYGNKHWQTTQQKIRQLQQDVRQQNLQNEQSQIRFDALTRELLQLKATDRSDWLLAEAEYLLRMANQHALLGQDAPAATALLTEADRVLQEITHPSEIQVYANIKKVTAIRQQIAEEREALILRSDVDREGLYLQLEAFIQQLEKMPVIDLESLSENAAATELEEEELFVPQSLGERMLKSLRQALEKIGGYLRIQHHDQAVNTLLSPSEQLYLKQNLRFMLEQAQIAVLQRQQTIFSSSLAKAKTWITEYYVMDSARKRTLLAELAVISSHNVEQALPDISGSLTSLKALMKLRRQQGFGE